MIALRSANDQVFLEAFIARLTSIDSMPYRGFNERELIWSCTNNGTIFFVKLGHSQMQAATDEGAYIGKSTDSPEVGARKFREGMKVEIVDAETNKVLRDCQRVLRWGWYAPQILQEFPLLLTQTEYGRYLNSGEPCVHQRIEERDLHCLIMINGIENTITVVIEAHSSYCLPGQFHQPVPL